MCLAYDVLDTTWCRYWIRKPVESNGKQCSENETVKSSVSISRVQLRLDKSFDQTDMLKDGLFKKNGH